MPIACDPRQTTELWLASDDDAPADLRPTFVYRYLTVAEFFQKNRLLAELKDAATDEARNAKVTEAIAVGMVGWRNLRSAPTLEQPDGEAISSTEGITALDRSLNYLEKLNLCGRTMDAVTMGGAEKKSSESPPTSEPVPSAPDALASEGV